tara:strand:+ start:814 stop:1191 length:378 start_codon:yes stop_codon:yes gene_type:complete
MIVYKKKDRILKDVLISVFFVIFILFTGNPGLGDSKQIASLLVIIIGLINITFEIIRISKPVLTITDNKATFHGFFRTYLVESIYEKEIWGRKVFELKFMNQKSKRKIDPKSFNNDALGLIKSSR